MIRDIMHCTTFLATCLSCLAISVEAGIAQLFLSRLANFLNVDIGWL